MATKAATYETSYAPLVADLEQDLAATCPHNVRSLPDMTDRVRHDGTYTSADGLSPGLYINPSLGMLGATALGFAEKPGRRLGAEESRHGVFFGDLSAGERVIPIAVKTMPEHDLGELALMQLFDKEGLPTFTPFGYLVSPFAAKDGALTRGHLLTVYQPGVEPIASMDWRELTDEEKWLYAGYAVDAMALMHPHMLFHTDLYFRNVTIDRGGDVIIPDLEHTVSMREAADSILANPGSSESDRLLQAIVRKLSADFTSVRTELDRFVFSTMKPRIKAPAAQFKRMRSPVFDRYKSQIADTNSEYTDILLEAYERMLVNKKEQVRTGTF